MKERLINNLSLKILSIFLAFFVWITVINVSNPEVSRSKEVPLEIENEQVLTQAKKTYELTGKTTITVTYDVRARDEYKIRSTDFRAYIDMAELYDVTSSVPIRVEVLNNKELISNASAKSGTMKVDIEDLQRKRFDLRIEDNVEPADGYAVNSITIEPDYIYVTGPTSKVGQISYVGVNLELNGIEGDAVGAVTPVLYDANDNKLSLGERVTLNTTEINYTVRVNRVKTLSVDFDVAGSVAGGYRYAGLECDIKSVSVQGLKSTLAELNTIVIPSSVLNINGASADRRVTVDLQEYLPEGVQIVGSSGIAEVLLKVERLESRKFRLSPDAVTFLNEVDNYQYVISPDVIELVVQGLSEDLDSLLLEDFGATVDVVGYEPGNTYPGKLIYNSNTVFDIISISEFAIITALQGEDVLAETTVHESDEETEDGGEMESKEETQAALSGEAAAGESSAVVETTKAPAESSGAQN